MRIDRQDLIRIRTGLRHYVNAWGGHPDGAERAAGYSATLAKIERLIEGDLND